MKRSYNYEGSYHKLLKIYIIMKPNSKIHQKYFYGVWVGAFLDGVGIRAGKFDRPGVRFVKFDRPRVGVVK